MTNNIRLADRMNGYEWWTFEDGTTAKYYLSCEEWKTGGRSHKFYVSRSIEDVKRMAGEFIRIRAVLLPRETRSFYAYFNPPAFDARGHKLLQCARINLTISADSITLSQQFAVYADSTEQA